MLTFQFSEIPDLLDVEQFNRLKEWNGELRFLQNFKLRRFSKNILKEENKKLPKTNQTNPPEMDVDS